MKQKEKYREGIKGKLAEHKEKLAHKKEERQQKKKKLD